MTPQEERLVQKLREMGIQVTTHPVDTSPFFYEWELRYAFVRVQRRDIDAALLDFLEALLLFVPVEEKRDFHE